MNLENSQASTFLKISIYDNIAHFDSKNPYHGIIEQYEQMLKDPYLQPGYAEILNGEIKRLKAASIDTTKPNFQTQPISLLSSNDTTLEFLSDDVAFAKRFASSINAKVSITRILITDLDEVQTQLRLIVPAQNGITADFSYLCDKQ